MKKKVKDNSNNRLAIFTIVMGVIIALVALVDMSGITYDSLFHKTLGARIGHCYTGDSWAASGSYIKVNDFDQDDVNALVPYTEVSYNMIFNKTPEKNNMFLRNNDKSVGGYDQMGFRYVYNKEIDCNIYQHYYDVADLEQRMQKLEKQLNGKKR